MSERKMHYFEFHFQKILAATKGWRDDEFGAFVKLLIEQFDRGFIPDDPEELSRLITTHKKNWPRLAKKFTAPSEPGELRNAFMITIRDSAQARSSVNAVNGKIGADEKKRKKSERLANAKAIVEQTDQQRFSQPVTSNQEPEYITLEEGKSVNTPAQLLDSNLFRRPKVPLREEVIRVFMQHGGTTEMAEAFFNGNEATEWFYKGSPITNFANLVPNYVGNWKRNLQKDQGQPNKSETSVAQQILAARAKQTS